MRCSEKRRPWRAQPGSITAILIGLFILLCCGAAFGQDGASGRRRVVIVLCDGLHLQDIAPDTCPALTQLLPNAAIGLMNCVTAGPRTSDSAWTSATLTLATGQQVPSQPSDELAFDNWESVPGELGPARTVYMRRLGPLDAHVMNHPAPDGESIRQLGIADLMRRNLASPRIGPLLGSLQPPVKSEVYGNADTDKPNRRDALLTVNSVGVGAGSVALARYRNDAPFDRADDPLALAEYLSESDADFVVIQLSDIVRLDTARKHLKDGDYYAYRQNALQRLDLLCNLIQQQNKSSREQDRPTDVLFIAPYPGEEEQHYPSPWVRPTPIIAFGPDFKPGLLTSPTTRTPGLIANVDIAPTILHLFSAVPSAEMTGRYISVAPSGGSAEQRVADVRRSDFVIERNEQGLVWILAPIGVCCLLLVVFGMAVRRYKGAAAAQYLAWAIPFTQLIPAAALLAPLLMPPTLHEYALRFLAWEASLTVLAYVISRLLRVSPPVSAALLTIALIVADTLVGQPLQKQSMLAGYAPGGVRYYGIGNEYLGVVLGFAIAGVFAILDDYRDDFHNDRTERSHYVAKLVFIGTVWVALTVVIGLPQFGANAGSLVASCSGFGIALMILTGRKPRMRNTVAMILLGLLTAAVFGFADAAVNGSNASHSGEAILAASGGRGGHYLAEIALRKISMNLHLLLRPEYWLLAALLTVPALAARAVMGTALASALSRHDWTRRGIYSLLSAGVAALIFKDSGVVTVVAMCGAACAFPLYYAMTEATPEEESRASA